MRISGAGVKSSIEQVLIDVTENFDGFSPFNNITSVSGEQRGRTTSFISTSPTGITPFSQNLSTAPTPTFDASIGRMVLPLVSTAAQRGRVSTAVTAGGARIPIAQRFSVAGALPIPFYRPLRRYTLLLPAKLTALAGGAAFFGVSDGAAGEGGGMPFSCAYGWVADPTINGGRYTARWRQAAAGAIVTQFDSGILGTAAVWRQLGIRYTEAATPTFEWLMDGVPVAVVSGDANMGIIASPGLGPFPAVTTLAGVGTTLTVGPARFIVEELG